MLLPKVSFFKGIVSPEIFVLDDPTSSLDTKVTRKIMTNIREHEKWKKKTFLITTNNPSLFEFADKVVYVNKGLVEFFGTYEEMMQFEPVRMKIEEIKKAIEISSQNELDQVIRYFMLRKPKSKNSMTKMKHKWPNNQLKNKSLYRTKIPQRTSYS
jgi:ABC-type multidrug transport system ATPase subunit